ncbi:MAG: ABC transporter ATP-binding protein [Kiritimatiellales bacterium]
MKKYRTVLHPLELNYQSAHPMRTLFRLLNRPWYYFVITTLLLLIKHSPVWAIPFLIAELIDLLVTPENWSMSRAVIYFSIVVVLTIQNIFSHTLFFVMLSGTIRDLEQTLRNALVTRMQHLSIAFHDRTESGRLQAKVLRDVEQVQTFCMLLGDGGMLAILSIVFAILVTVVREPKMLIVFLILVPLCIALRAAFHHRILAHNNAFREEVERMSAGIVEMLNMIPVVRAHGLESMAASEMERQFDEVNRSGRKLDRIDSLFGSSAWVVFQLSVVCGLIVLVWFNRRGLISIGDIVLYQSLFSMIVMCVSQLLGIYPRLMRGIESIRSIGEILECPDLELNDGRASVAEIGGHVEFDDVSFVYDVEKNHGVKNFSLDVKPGECVAFVGPSGAGKSTVIQLLIGFRRPQAGRILFDRRDMEACDMRTVRRHISVVPQETVLFSGTIRENILYGLSGISDERLMEVLTAAHLADVVAELPEGLETKIGEDGAMLSGGQRQRIAIARALVRNPKILVLDEATSALDTVSEKKVQDAIDSAVINRTTFIVAHRLSTIRRADRIVVMKNGRIVEIGSYSELMECHGFFYEMQQSQGGE